MPRFIKMILTLICFWLGQTANAWEAVHVEEAQGQLRHHVNVSPSPKPGYCYWESEIPVVAFHATEADGYGNMDCPHPWLARCDTDSLSFHGSYPDIESSFVTGADFQASLFCTVILAEETRLSARRQVVGDLFVDEHSLTVTMPDGAIVTILEPGSGTDQAEMVLDPGSYTVSIYVYAYQIPQEPGAGLLACSSGVSLQWEDPGSVEVQPVTWGALKAVFRN